MEETGTTQRKEGHGLYAPVGVAARESSDNGSAKGNRSPNSHIFFRAHQCTHHFPWPDNRTIVCSNRSSSSTDASSNDESDAKTEPFAYSSAHDDPNEKPLQFPNRITDSSPHSFTNGCSHRGTHTKPHCFTDNRYVRELTSYLTRERILVATFLLFLCAGSSIMQ